MNLTLYCTASVSASGVAMELPEDGLCDYMFFDSLYHGGQYKITDGAPIRELASFLKKAEAGRVTKYGVGINFA